MESRLEQVCKKIIASEKITVLDQTYILKMLEDNKLDVTTLAKYLSMPVPTTLRSIERWKTKQAK